MKEFILKYKNNFLLLVLLNSIAMLLYIFARFFHPMPQILAGIVPYTLRFHLLLIFIFFLLIIKPLLNSMRDVGKKTWFILIIVLIVGFYQFWIAAPFTHRIYFDEDIYMNIASNIVNNGQALKTNFGTPVQCYEGEYNKDPSGMPALISVFFGIFGINEYLASRVTVLISILNVLLVFAVSYLLFKKELLSLFAAFIFILLPENIIWAPTIAAEPYQVFFAGACLIGIILYVRTWDWKALFFSLLVLSYAAQTRSEGILLLGVAGIYFLFSRGFEEQIKDKGFLAAWVFFYLLLLPQCFTFAAFRDESWGASGVPMFGFMHFFNNFKTNSFYFFENTRTPLLVSVMALFGIFPLRRWLKEKGLLIFMFILYFSIFLFFYAGSYNFGTDVRFSLILNLPLAILAAFGIDLITSTILKRFNSAVISGMWVIFLVLSFYLIYPSIPLGEEAIGARMSHDYMVKILHELPENSYLFSYDPCIAVINGRKGTQTIYAGRAEVVNRMFSETDQVYFYQDIWSQIPPYKDQWKNLLKRFDLEYLKGKPFREFNFNLYRLRQK